MCLIVTHRGSSDGRLVKDSNYVVTMHLEILDEDANTEAEVIMMLVEFTRWSMAF